MVKMVSAVGARGECSFEAHEGSMNADRFTGFLENLLHDFDRPVFLVVDGSSGHKARKVKGVCRRYRRQAGTVLPAPYSPELTPGEGGKQEREARQDSAGGADDPR